MHTLRADNGGEFVNQSLKTWLSDRAIKIETSAPYSPEQNGVSERANRTIMEGGRSLIYAKHLPLELWGEAIACAVYSLNRVCNSTSPLTPYENWYGKKPDISHLRIFGSTAFIHVPKIERHKLESKSFKCYFVGYSLTQKAYRFWDPVGRKIKISRDVIFDENCNFHSHFSPQPDNFFELCPRPIDPATTSQQQVTNTVAITPPVAGEMDIQLESSPECSLESENTSSNHPEDNPVQTEGPDNSAITHGHDLSHGSTSIRHSPYPLRVRVPTRQWSSLLSTDVQKTEVYEPTSYSDAMECADAHLWKIAIQEEYDSLMSNKTWRLSSLPANRTSIKSRWVFKVKPGTQDSPPRYKARLVAKGFSQRPGIDFEETFSPVVKHDTLRLILSLVATLDLDMSQLDVKTAFLYGEIEEEIYLEQPEGYVIAGQEDSVCRLQKCLYGLKQASRVWNRHFDSFLKRFGLQSSDADPCLYFRRNNKEVLFVLIWVDDGLVISDDANLVTQVIEYLKKYFEMRCTHANHFVGISITRNRRDKVLYLSQPDYIKKILKKFHMTDCHPKDLPASPGCRLVLNVGEDSLEDVPYREAIDSLLYLTIVSRPDIAFAVGQAAQFSENPQKHHWVAVRRIFAYLKGTQDYGIRFGPNHDCLRGYSDSDFAGDLNSRRSTTAFIFILNGGPVAWASRRQPCVTLSSTESEFVAACEAAKEAVWLKRLMKNAMPEWNESIPLMCDNQSTIQLIRNPVFHQRTKHIDVKYYFVRERQEAGDVDFAYISTNDQLADPLTKILPNPRFSSLRELMGILPVPSRHD